MPRPDCALAMSWAQLGPVRALEGQQRKGTGKAMFSLVRRMNHILGMSKNVQGEKKKEKEGAEFYFESKQQGCYHSGHLSPFF